MARRNGLRTVVKVGLPMVLLLTGGSYLLSTFTATQFEQKDKRMKKTSKKVHAIEEEHKRMMAKLNIDDYALSRIPRPNEPDTVEGAEKRRQKRHKVPK
jgi:hypothetical protein